jgi:argininosuccinate lyase
MEEEAKKGFTNATESFEYLAKKNVPFREAHAIVGRLVLECTRRGCALEDLTLTELKNVSPVLNRIFMKQFLSKIASINVILPRACSQALQEALDKSREILQALK